MATKRNCSMRKTVFAYREHQPRDIIREETTKALTFKDKPSNSNRLNPITLISPEQLD
uniref:Uncharacterized protein n=1 Tax=Cucumis melo TaxID=3656 RepID=A0A9I9DYS9_CUCME